MKLIIHIGTHKTGTTSFQKLCRFHKNLLSSEGINFPSYKDWIQHSHAAWIAQRRDFCELKLFLQAIYDETLELSCGIALVSGEDFENFLVDTNLASEFTKIALEVGFKDLEWIVVQRNPFEYLQSLYAEMSNHKTILDYQTMSTLILKYGYFSVSNSNYNYHFVFKINKFAKIFKENVSTNLNIISFDEFIKGFVGNLILSRFISDSSQKFLLEYSQFNKKENLRNMPEKVELNYLLNFFNIQKNHDFYIHNEKFFSDLIINRIEKNKIILDNIKKNFKNTNF